MLATVGVHVSFGFQIFLLLECFHAHPIFLFEWKWNKYTAESSENVTGKQSGLGVLPIVVLSRILLNKCGSEGEEKPPEGPAGLTALCGRSHGSYSVAPPLCLAPCRSSS